MSGWEVRFSNSRQQPYFYNPQTSQSVWDAPAELSQDQIMRLPGATRYLQAPAGGAGSAPAKEGQARASHILCKHAGSRRPSSWRQVRHDRDTPSFAPRIQCKRYRAFLISRTRSLDPSPKPESESKLTSPTFNPFLPISSTPNSLGSRQRRVTARVRGKVEIWDTLDRV